ncbi:MAG: glutaredoxin family protein [Pseudomonadota bacterium]
MTDAELTDPMTQELRVFWQPGCSSCLRTKEFLTENGVPFRSVDVLNDDGGMAELAALGIRTVPIVARGREYVSGQILRDVAAFAGIDGGSEVLPPDQLKARIDTVIAAAMRYAAQLPHQHLDDMLPDRPRSYRDLACHVFQIVEAFIAETGGDPLTAQKYEDPAPKGVRTVSDIVFFGYATQKRFSGWWDGGGHDFTRKADVYYGDQTLHDFMERTAWHAGQHTRQLMLVLEKLGVSPDQPLMDQDFAGLPMPKEVWDNEKRWD